MVDFQSRDTRRGPVTDDDNENEADEEEADEAAAETGTEPGEDSEEQRPESAGGREQTDPLAASEPEPAETDPEPAEPDTGASIAEPDSAPTESGPAPQSSDTAAAGATAERSETAPDQGSVEPARTIDVAVVTVGDASEGAVVEPLESAGHTIATRERLRADYDGLQRSVDTLVSRDDVDVVVTTGGIGIGADAVTIEAVHPLFEKALPGFGEAFRTLLYDVIGTGIVAVRSAAGVADGTLVFCLPADAEAAGLAVEEILVTEAPELVAHLDS
jgi:molybdenum cofactor biosynthesis protein B